MLVVIGAGDAVRAQQRPAVDLQAHHDELAVLESKSLVTRGGEGKLTVGPVLNVEHALTTNRSQDPATCQLIDWGRPCYRLRTPDEARFGLWLHNRLL